MYIYQIERDLLKKSINKFAHYISGDAMDVGSSLVGRYAKLFKNTTRYTTLDINPKFKPDIVGSVDSIPVNESKYDSIVCTQVIGDVLYPAEAIAEFSRILKNGGYLLVTEGFLNEIHDEPNDYWRFTPFALEKLLTGANFKVIEKELIGGIFCVITQLIIRYFINSLDLYRHRFLGRIFSSIFFVMGKIATILDSVFRNSANNKIGIDVVFVAQKI